MVMARVVNELSGGIFPTRSGFSANRAWSRYRKPLPRQAVPLPLQKVIRRTGQPISRMTSPYRTQRAAKTKARIQAEGAARLDAARRASDLARRRSRAQRAEAIRRIQLRKARIMAVSPNPPTKRAGVKAWEAWYARRGVVMPESVKETTQRDDKAAFYNAVAGKYFIAKQPGINPRLGVTWMFNAAYNGQTMPYWKAWYDRSMTAPQIAALVAADYTAEIQRRLAVQAQYSAKRDAWDEAGKIGIRPIRTPFLLPDLPVMPQAPERRAGRPQLPDFPKTAIPQIPQQRGRIWEELPPLY